METFIWDQHFTTGLERVDAQHHHLVDLINQLGESLIAGEVEEPEALQEIFGQLADYAQYHFAEEERLMEETGVDSRHRDPHHRHHAEFVEQVSTMWNSRNSMASAAETLHGFLRSWLGFHILGEDQAMARQIALIRIGKSPDQAYEMDSAQIDNATSALLQALQNLYQVLSGQNRDLAAANFRLEERVAERTSELAQANQALTGLNHRLEALSNSDGLLGIANRRYFDARLDEEWRRAVREHQSLSLLMIDVDYFKRYNDTYGHQEGDRCLQSVVQAALSAFKRPGDLLARYGGEELVVILPNTELNGAILVAQAIQHELAALHIPHADSAVADVVTVSIGAATMRPDQQKTSAMLVAVADRGLYSAKESGRNRVCSGE
ncbi:MAG: bacteriohemerythrin [Rhodocyclales bacterium]|nr:bacteriohemerythrin [Rhodocyclales bacterium]